MKKVHWSKYAHSPWDNSAIPGFWDELRKRTQKLCKTTDKALVITCCCNPFEWGTFL
jgi:uroporphyrinogen decarboxylase